MLKKELLKPALLVQRKLPANLAEDECQFYRSEISYKTYNCYLKFVSAAWVTADSIVYRKGFLVNETLYSNEYERYYQTRYLLKKTVTAKKIKLDKAKKYLLATDYYSGGHFHWLTEALPRLYCVKNIAKDFVLLLPDIPYIRKIAIKSIELLGIEFQDIILMKENEFYKADNLFYITKLTHTGQLHDEVMQEINARFLHDKKSGDKKIYISREKAKFRKVLNEKELTEVLRANGFEILYGEDLSIVEQISVFSSCQTLLGIHGAGLTNCLFMHPGNQIIELKKREKNYGYWHLSSSLNHKYCSYNGTPDSEKTLIGNGCNLTISIKDFENQILQFI